MNQWICTDLLCASNLTFFKHNPLFRFHEQQTTIISGIQELKPIDRDIVIPKDV